MPFKRPFAAIGAATLLSTLLFGKIYLWLGVLAVELLFVIFLRFRACAGLLVLTAVYVIVGALTLGSYALGGALSADLDGRNAYIEGYVCELPEEKSGGKSYVLRLEKATAEGETFACGGKARMHAESGFSADVYDKVTLSARVTAVPPSKRFDGERYVLSVSDTPRVTGRAPKRPYYYCLMLKKYMLRMLAADGESERSALLWRF